ncbi:hypothetical protein ACEZCY_30255 [Streptacidiphilus sp. N1-12]|uniref:Uncharacterized protein n=2 Tax=Streptacidiphilus alkalitolerans TaxID=3342712 RepID=A0ABV6VJ30_9ACTN
MCILEYRVDPGGSTSWTALTTLNGELAASGSTRPVHRSTLELPEGVAAVTLPAALARDHGLRAVLSNGSKHFSCLVGPEA